MKNSYDEILVKAVKALYEIAGVIIDFAGDPETEKILDTFSDAEGSEKGEGVYKSISFDELARMIEEKTEIERHTVNKVLYAVEEIFTEGT